MRLRFPIRACFLAFFACIPAQAFSETIPWSEIGAKATADYAGDGLAISEKTSGTEINCVFQKLTGEATTNGLWIESTSEGGGRFMVKASALGRTTYPATLSKFPDAGNLENDGKLVRFTRPGVTEEYSSSVDGIRQDFLIDHRADGTGELSVELDLQGATAEPSPNGVRITLQGSDRKLNYHRLHVTDATGKELPARMKVFESQSVQIKLLVDDTDATYPIRIDPTFSDANWISMGGLPGANNGVSVALVDASDNLYIGGDFTVVGDVLANRIAKWDGTSWSPLGSGINSSVLALAVSGSNLYAAGRFNMAGGNPVGRIARWDGTTWSPLGSGTNGEIRALAITGGDLYAAGTFNTAGENPANRIAKWDGTTWSPLGSGMNDFVNNLAISGGDIYAGGAFTTAGGNSANRIALWNGTAWSPLGSGMDDEVRALVTTGGELYAGGIFTTAGGISAIRIARWDGTTWSPLGSGMNSDVLALAVSEGELYAGGHFTTAGGIAANHIARWDGTTWSPLGSGTNGVISALAISGGELYVGGFFTPTTSNPARYIGRWDGSAWSSLGNGINNNVHSIAVSGSNLYVAGDFVTAGETAANRIARWDGTTWSPLDSGMNNSVRALAVYGDNLYAGGLFSSAGGVEANRIAKWNGTAWSPLGTGVDGDIYTLAVSGNNLYAAGLFNFAGGDAASRIARWDGTTWSPLGSGVNGSVFALAVMGNDLYAAGIFSLAGGVNVNNIAKWNGTAWSPLANGLNNTVFALTVAEENLYAGGVFSSAGEILAEHIAKWDGTVWSPLGSGMNSLVLSLAASGDKVYAGGFFTTAGGIPANFIAQWDGTAWSPLGSGTNTSVNSLIVSGDDLYAGGEFTMAGGKVSAYIARAQIGETNSPPSADAQNLSTVKNTSLEITLSGTDPDDDSLTYTVASDPSHGSLDGVAPNLIYTPDSEYVGEDSFTFFANDGTADSAPATITIQVNEPPFDYTYTIANSEVTITDYTGIGGVISIPASIEGLPVTVIGDSAFYGNTTITEVTIPNSVTSIEANAFYICTNLTTITLPPNLLSIGEFAFFSCSQLTNINLPLSLTSIGAGAFHSCTSLSSITLPIGIVTINSETFANCSNLTTVNLPSNLSTIGNSAFLGCSKLPSISIPSSVSTIISNAFHSCPLLTGAFFQGDAPSMGADVFGEVAPTFIVYFLIGKTGFTTPTWFGYQTVGVQAPLITSEPSNQTIANGATATLTVSTDGSPAPTLQWYLGESGDTSQPISGETNSSFTTPALTETRSYWVRASSTLGTADSQTAIITIGSGNNANLSALSLGMPPLSPGFNQLTTTYTSSVPNSITSISVTPTAAASGASIKVNGLTVQSGMESSPINLNLGSNLIQVVVTAPDLITTKTYSITVLRTEPSMVTTEPAMGVGSFGAILHGTVVPNGGASVYFEYGTTTSYGNSTPPQYLSGNTTLPFQSTISGLPGGTLIHFRAVVSQLGTTTNGMNRTFTTLPPPVIVVTGNPVVTADTAATLVGAVNTQGQQAEVFFEYGTTTAYGNSTTPRIIPAGSGLQDVLEGITGLIPNTFYHVRLVSTSPSPVGGNDVVFQAKVVSGSGTGSPTAVPTVTTGAVVDVQDDAGTLKGTVNANGGTTTAYFEYGTTSSFGQVSDVQPIGNGNEDAEVSIPATDLLPGTRYYYRLMAENSLGLSVPGAEAFFDTNFSPPVVTTGSAEALTTTSVRISGTVQAENADTDVEIIYGTNPSTLSDGIATTPALITGDEETSVSADLEDLLQSVTYYYRVRAVNSGGTTLGELMTFRVSTLSGLLQIFPDELDPADHEGSLQVNITPGEIGAGWRLSGEQAWRLPGETVSGLTSGDRVIEYRAISGYLAPSSETLTVVSGDPSLLLDRTYVASGASGSGSLTVSIKPDTIADALRPVAERAQWRLLGETDSDWKDSGEVSAGLPPGNHVVECKPIAGRSTPPPASVVVSDGATTSAILTYYEADPTVGDLPDVLDFETVRDEEGLPYAYVGQIRSDAGSSTGFVVRPRVVATVAHAVFDDGTLASATGLQWLFQRHRGVHESTPMIPRGFYTLTGYAAQRAADNSPGISTPESQHLDAAAMYFSEDSARFGFSGYLASDLDENEFLLSTALKTLVGYPVENIAEDNLDRMHATTPEDITFTLPTGTTRTFTTEAIRSTGGGSGGPLCVLASNGKFYPAAIYLGGTAQTIVRAIDSDVAALFGFAEISANSADGSGRGSITVSETSPVGTPSLGSLRVIIEPAGIQWCPKFPS